MISFHLLTKVVQTRGDNSLVVRVHELAFIGLITVCIGAQLTVHEGRFRIKCAGSVGHCRPQSPLKIRWDCK